MKFIYLIFVVIALFFIESINLNSAEESDNSWTVNYLEQKLSTTERQVKIIGVSGTLSSKAKIKQILISDNKGIWLIIENVILNWDRADLLKGLLNINKLNINSINILRQPEKSKQKTNLWHLLNSDLSDFALNVNIKSIVIQHVALAQQVCGKQAEFYGKGYFKFIGNNLDSNLNIKYLNGKGSLSFMAHYNTKDKNFQLKLNGFEDKNNIIAHLLKIKDASNLNLNIQGGGSLNNMKVTLSGDIGKRRILSGLLSIKQAEALIAPSEENNANAAKDITLQLGGKIKSLLPQEYQAFFQENTNVNFHGLIFADNSMQIDDFTISGSILHLHAYSSILADGFLDKLSLKASIHNINQPNAILKLNLASGPISLNSAQLNIDYGINSKNLWQANLKLNDLITNNSAINASLNFNGITENLKDPAQRHITIEGDGFFTHNKQNLKLNLSSEVRANSPILIRKLQITSKNNKINFNGMYFNKKFTGYSVIALNDLRYISDIFGLNYSGKIINKGSSLINFANKNLIIQQNLNSFIKINSDKNFPEIVNKILQKPNQINGAIYYNFNQDHLLKLERVNIKNDKFKLYSDGYLSNNNADLHLNIAKFDLNMLHPMLQGDGGALISAVGHNGNIVIGTRIKSNKLIWNKEKLEKFSLCSAAIIHNPYRITRENIQKNITALGNIEAIEFNNKLKLNFDIENLNNIKFYAYKLPARLLQPYIKYHLPTLYLSGQADLYNKDLRYNLSGKGEMINAQLKGKYDLTTKNIDAEIKNESPIDFLNEFLLKKHMSTQGKVNLAAKITGDILNPNVNGGISIKNTQFQEKDLNINLKNINIDAAIENSIIKFKYANADFVPSGRVSLSGSINLTNTKKPISYLDLNLRQISYSKGLHFNALCDGQLKITDDIINKPTIQGFIKINRGQILLTRDITSFAPIASKHINSNRGIITTLKRANLDQDKTENLHKKSIILDIAINSPSQFFVHGMGLDAEMMGNLLLKGDIKSLQPTGLLKMKRGTFNFLSKKLDFDEGSITLDGDLKPKLKFISHYNGHDISTKVELLGRSDNIKLNLTSTPELPQDEIIAHLLFNRSINQLSPWQIAQIITILSNFSGQANIFDNIKTATKLDNINIDSDENGNIDVNAGWYLTNNIYTNVGTTQHGTTKASVNWELNNYLKAVGQYSSDNKNNVGIYYGKDY